MGGYRFHTGVQIRQTETMILVGRMSPEKYRRFFTVRVSHRAEADFKGIS